MSSKHNSVLCNRYVGPSSTTKLAIRLLSIDRSSVNSYLTAWSTSNSACFISVGNADKRLLGESCLSAICSGFQKNVNLNY